ncbi:MAG: hypothetical protein EOO56_07885 [Hymenobacter sp.]|nr:MAG: hypothetical protein EOO56_07885 [Hymenobacter sp.]
MTTKTFLTLSALLVAASTSYGQQGRPASGTPQAATTMTREMSNRLRLNEGQYVKLYSINRTRLTRQQEIEQATTKDAAARTAQLAELQSQYEQECARILTPSQLSLMQQDQTQAPAGNGQG